ncbi:hypothetical protein ACFVQB_20910 [Paenibacillus sp. NPDC057886]|uniref:hypothetical protein n=1 Tax=Paenibacillus sp. NPDC057886 TaxID=3346270 RepID=UPI00369AD2C8
MNALDLYSKEDVHHWLKYSPKDPQYLKFSPNILAAGFKIVDVYHSFCYGRQSLLFIESKDYGELVFPKDDNISTLSLRANFLLNALAFYNYCIDISWQVSWFFYGDYGRDIIEDNSKFAKASTKCTFDELNYILTLARDIKSRNIYREFFNHKLTVDLREKYNLVKHRGSLHFKGLGIQYENIGIRINGETPKMLTNEVVEVDLLKDQLIKFDIMFKRYFDSLIRGIMPSDYLDNNYTLDDILNFRNSIR